MNRMLMAAVVAFSTGVFAGYFGTPLVSDAHAASGPIAVQSGRDVIARCDFTKTIILLVDAGYACVPK